MANASIRNPEAWLKKAEGDIKIIKKCLRDDDETLDGAVYHAQQAAEKALKAFLIFQQQEIPKIHDLLRLLKLCAKIDFSFIQLEDYAADLTMYVTYARYPDDWFVVDRPEAESALKKAIFIVQFCKQRINP